MVTVIEEWPRYVLAIVLPLSLAVVWGVFAVPGDPSRSGQAPVPVSGMIRLLLELAVFAVAVWCLYASDARGAALVLAVATVGHYLLSYDRVAWLHSR